MNATIQGAKMNFIFSHIIATTTALTLTQCIDELTANGGTEITINQLETQADIIAPSITFTAENLTINSNTSTEVMLNASDDIDVTVGATVICENGSFEGTSFTAPIVTSQITINCTATAEDEAGNSSTAVLTFTIVPSSAGPSAKNIVMIMLDDADFSDFGFNNDLLNAPDALTPNMDALRLNGRLLRNFYTGSSICSPSRASLLTGKNPIAVGALSPWPTSIAGAPQSSGNSNGLPNNIPQLGLLMKEMGKATGHYGKWHVGFSREKYKPAALGFDQFGLYRPISPRGWSGGFEFETESTTFTKDIDYIDFEFGNMVEDFIVENANSPNGFFVNYWPLTPHFPWSPPESFDNIETNFDLDTNRGKLLAMMYSVDKQIGDIVQTLKDTGQYEDTLILLTSDNGGQSLVRNTSAYLKGTKSTLLEGGVKVSLVAHWPNGIAPSSTNESVISMYDLLPTILDLTGYADGVESLYPVIDGRSKRLAMIDQDIIPHDPIIWEINTPGNFQTDNEFAEKTYSLLKDKMRLVKLVGRDRRNPAANPYFLYDLNADPRGQTSVARNNPQLVESLSEELESLRKSSSRISYIPKSLSARTTFNSDSTFDDPRLDVTSKDFTFQFEIDIPSSLPTREILFQKEGTSTLYLESNLSLTWEINGVNGNSSPVTEILSTLPISPGKHDINLGINGYRTDSPRIRIYVDNDIHADASLQSGNPTQLFSLLRNISPLHIGSSNVPMDNIDYYQLKIYPGE